MTLRGSAFLFAAAGIRAKDAGFLWTDTLAERSFYTQNLHPDESDGGLAYKKTSAEAEVVHGIPDFLCGENDLWT